MCLSGMVKTCNGTSLWDSLHDLVCYIMCALIVVFFFPSFFSGFFFFFAFWAKATFQQLNQLSKHIGLMMLSKAWHIYSFIWALKSVFIYDRALHVSNTENIEVFKNVLRKYDPQYLDCKWYGFFSPFCVWGEGGAGSFRTYAIFSLGSSGWLVEGGEMLMGIRWRDRQNGERRVSSQISVMMANEPQESNDSFTLHHNSGQFWHDSRWRASLTPLQGGWLSWYQDSELDYITTRQMEIKGSYFHTFNMT